MTTPLKENGGTYESARRRVQALRDLYSHTTIYVVVNAILVGLDVVTGGGLWFYWPLMGWGIGLAAHAASVLCIDRLWGADWEARKIKDIVRHGD